MSHDEMQSRINEALEMVGLSHHCFHDPSRLSGGQKQRAAIAGVLALKPDLLILDDFFVMLDPRSGRELLDSLRMLKQSTRTYHYFNYT